MEKENGGMDTSFDLKQIEAALVRIPAPMRYWIALFAELLADGVEANQARGAALAQRQSSERNKAVQKAGFDASRSINVAR